LGIVLAKNIVKYRNENGHFSSRNELTKVPRLGPKAFEQSAGFLRINDGPVILDRSAVHPESYHIVDKMAKDLNCDVEALIKNKHVRDKIQIKKYATEKTGIPTLNDILAELAKPGRDPREELQEFSFAQGITKISDLETGMRLPGIVTNITAFGAFVDVGVHLDGLVHISEMSDIFVKDPNSIVKVHQKVVVRILEVDIVRNRISLSMKKNLTNTEKPLKKYEPINIDSKKNQSGHPKTIKPSLFNNPFSNLLKKH
jgi:uncharacterized protein